jgi:hypothetical protein
MTKVYGDPLAQLPKGYAEEVYGFKVYILLVYFLFESSLDGHRTRAPSTRPISRKSSSLSIGKSLKSRLQCASKLAQNGCRQRDSLTDKVARIAVSLKACSTQRSASYSTLTAGPPALFLPSPTLEPLDTSQPLTRGAFDTLPDTRTVGWPPEFGE